MLGLLRLSQHTLEWVCMEHSMCWGHWDHCSMPWSGLCIALDVYAGILDDTLDGFSYFLIYFGNYKRGSAKFLSVIWGFQMFGGQMNRVLPYCHQQNTNLYLVTSSP